MKTIFLISSIFYILGLKIGQKIDWVVKYNPVEKITATTNVVKKAAKSVNFNDEAKTVETDTLKSTVTSEKKKVMQNN